MGLFLLLFLQLVFIFFFLLLLSVWILFIIQVDLFIMMCIWVVEVVLLLFCLWNALLHLYFVNTEYASQQIGRLRMAQLYFTIISRFLADSAFFWFGIDAQSLNHNGGGLGLVLFYRFYFSFSLALNLYDFFEFSPCLSDIELALLSQSNLVISVILVIIVRRCRRGLIHLGEYFGWLIM